MLRIEADKLHYTINDAQLAQYAERGVDPPDCMQFELVESISTPLYGHHFKETKTFMIYSIPFPRSCVRLQ